MYLAFATKELREICEYDDVAIRTLGSGRTARLHARLADLVAAKSPVDLPGDPPTLHSRCSNTMVLHLDKSCQIRFVANHTSPPTNKGGNIIWEKVSRIKIIGVRSYDDD